MKVGTPSWNASRPSTAFLRRSDRASHAAYIDMKSVSPPTDGRVSACSIEAAGGVSSNVTSLCQVALKIASPFPSRVAVTITSGIVGVTFKPGVQRLDVAETRGCLHQLVRRQPLARKEQDLVFEPGLAQGRRPCRPSRRLRSIPEISAPICPVRGRMLPIVTMSDSSFLLARCLLSGGGHAAWGRAPFRVTRCMIRSWRAVVEGSVVHGSSGCPRSRHRLSDQDQRTWNEACSQCSIRRFSSPRLSISGRPRNPLGEGTVDEERPAACLGVAHHDRVDASGCARA